MEIEYIKTKDGSSTFYVPELDEHYHSVNGAIQESTHVFIQAGLEQIQSNEVHIFEMGFGTGLNALLTFENTSINKKIVHYHAIEKYPLKEDQVEKLVCSLDKEESRQFLRKLHAAAWETEEEVAENFCLIKYKNDIVDFSHQREYNLVYFDAFAPDKLPECWSQEIFEKLFLQMTCGGILVTYSAKGVVRRMLQNVGFVVERIPDLREKDK